jgi:hypothetical protein
MSNLIPVFQYPGGTRVDPTKVINNNIMYKWVNDLGGAQLDGPLQWGTICPDGTLAHGGILTASPDGTMTIEYHFAGQ